MRVTGAIGKGYAARDYFIFHCVQASSVVQADLKLLAGEHLRQNVAALTRSPGANERENIAFRDLCLTCGLACSLLRL
jgi:hypothetical protein